VFTPSPQRPQWRSAHRAVGTTHSERALSGSTSAVGPCQSGASTSRSAAAPRRAAPLLVGRVSRSGTGLRCASQRRARRRPLHGQSSLPPPCGQPGRRQGRTGLLHCPTLDPLLTDVKLTAPVLVHHGGHTGSDGSGARAYRQGDHWRCRRQRLISLCPPTFKA
jgi:hypothetical protein